MICIRVNMPATLGSSPPRSHGPTTVNTREALVDASTQVIPVPMDSVTSANVAIAINANCVGCHSSAVAVQILIVRGSPSYFAPGNAAGAANGGCDSCGAYAYARQHWIQTSSNAHLSGAVRQQIAQIRQQISTTAASILPSDAASDPDLSRDHELDARLDALTSQLIQVVTAQMRVARDRFHIEALIASAMNDGDFTFARPHIECHQSIVPAQIPCFRHRQQSGREGGFAIGRRYTRDRWQQGHPGEGSSTVCACSQAVGIRKHSSSSRRAEDADEHHPGRNAGDR